jgi:hypothetical protein
LGRNRRVDWCGQRVFGKGILGVWGLLRSRQ